MLHILVRSNNKFIDMYPSLATYISAKEERDSIKNNKEFNDKYNKNRSLVNTFINEISKYYKQIEIYHMIYKYIINLPEEEMVKIITTYLNLSMDEKEDREFFKYYDRLNGMIDKTQEEIDIEKSIDDNYNSLKQGNETFNNIKLDDLYETLDYPERSVIVSILSNKGWNTFRSFYEERFHINFSALMKLLNNKLIDGTIINENVKNNLGDYDFEELIFTLTSNNNVEITKHIKTLINKNRYDLIKDMINNQLIGDHIFVDILCNEITNDNELIEKLESIRVKRPVNN